MFSRAYVSWLHTSGIEHRLIEWLNLTFDYCWWHLRDVKILDCCFPYSFASGEVKGMSCSGVVYFSAPQSIKKKDTATNSFFLQLSKIVLSQYLKGFSRKYCFSNAFTVFACRCSSGHGINCDFCSYFAKSVVHALLKTDFSWEPFYVTKFKPTQNCEKLNLLSLSNFKIHLKRVTFLHISVYTNLQEFCSN